MELTAGVAALLSTDEASADIASPIYVPERRDLEPALRDAVRLPRALGAPVRDRVDEVLAGIGARPAAAAFHPVAVMPGSLGSWTEEEAG